MRSGTILAAITSLAVAGLGAGVAHAKAVVIKSEGPSQTKYKVGTELPDNATLDLKAGDRVTVITTRGTRVISGPGPKSIGASSQNRRSTFAVLTRQTSGDAVRPGAVRAGGPGELVENDNLWNLDVSTGGRMCIVGTDGLRLFRPRVDSEETYVFGTAGSDFHTHVTFDKGVALASVGAEELPLVAGRTYSVSAPSGDAARSFDLAILDQAPRDMTEMAALLAANECTGQLDMLAEKVMLTD